MPWLACLRNNVIIHTLYLSSGQALLLYNVHRFDRRQRIIFIRFTA